jgi:anti-anti-sigma factor
MPAPVPSPALPEPVRPPAFAVDEPLRAVGAPTVLVVEGELDIATAPELDGRLRAVEAAASRLLLDLRRLSFMDSTGLAVILSCCDRRLSRGEEAPRLVVADGQVRRVLELTGCAALIADAAALG